MWIVEPVQQIHCKRMSPSVVLGCVGELCCKGAEGFHLVFEFVNSYLFVCFMPDALKLRSKPKPWHVHRC